MSSKTKSSAVPEIKNLTQPTSLEKADTQLVDMEPILETMQQKTRRLKALIDAATMMYKSKSYPNEVRARFLAKIDRYQEELDELQK